MCPYVELNISPLFPVFMTNLTVTKVNTEHTNCMYSMWQFMFSTEDLSAMKGNLEYFFDLKLK